MKSSLQNLKKMRYSPQIDLPVTLFTLIFGVMINMTAYQQFGQTHESQAHYLLVPILILGVLSYFMEMLDLDYWGMTFQYQSMKRLREVHQAIRFTVLLTLVTSYKMLTDDWVQAYIFGLTLLVVGVSFYVIGCKESKLERLNTR